jgi:nicotinate-nucleotide adenylyltransferase
MSIDEISEKVDILCFKRNKEVTIAERSMINKYSIVLVNNPINTSSSSDIRVGEIPFLNEEIISYCIKNDLYVKQIIKSKMSEYRFIHSLSVCKQMILISKGINISEYKKIACSIFHDIAKDFSDKELIEYNNKHKCMKTKIVPLLHGPVGADYCKRHIGIKDKEVLNAIKYHTQPRIKPTKLEKLLFIADKSDPSRKTEIGRIITKLAFDSIDQAFNFSVCYSKFEIAKRNKMTDFFKFPKFKYYFKKLTVKNRAILLQTLKSPSYT